MATVGSGEFTYDVLDNWAKTPDGWWIGQAEPACDSQDRVYVFNRGDHPLMIFDRDGNFLNEWGREYLTDAHGIFISGEDHVYLPVRESHAIVKCTLDGKPLMTMGVWDAPSDTGGARPDGTMWKAAGPFNRCTRHRPGPQRRPVRIRRVCQQPGASVLARWSFAAFLGSPRQAWAG